MDVVQTSVRLSVPVLVGWAATHLPSRHHHHDHVEEPPRHEAPSDVAAVALDKKKRVSFELKSRTWLNHDTVLLRFALPTSRHVLGLPAGQHLFCYAVVDGESIVRAYSTITPPETRGYFEIALKVYFADDKHPEGGKMSQHLSGLEIGSKVEFKGPVGRFVYHGLGRYSKNRKEAAVSKMYMIGGGTGINPLLQITKKILNDPTDVTTVSIIDANKTKEDILFHEELDMLSRKHWNLSVFHVLEKAPWHWMQGRGRIDQKTLEHHLRDADEDSILLMCGPGPMTDSLSQICIDRLGWTKDRITIF